MELKKENRVTLMKLSLTHIQRGEVPFLEEIENMNIQRGDEEVSQRQKWKHRRECQTAKI